MGITYGLELDGLKDVTDDDPGAAAIGENCCEDVSVCVGVYAAKGEDVYAHCDLVLPDITVD